MTSLELPTFDNPPVGEVALSVQYPKVAKLQAAHLGFFWQQIQAEFPQTETHPPIEGVVEKFEKPVAVSTPSLQLRQPSVIPRAWFISTDGTHLVQIQANRFVCNWRRIRPSDSYHRYPHVRAIFERLWPRWNDFLIKERLIDAPLSVDQCEITYTNHIAREGVWHTYNDAPKIVRFLSPTTMPASEMTGEFVSFSTHYQIQLPDPDDGKRAVGRVHIEFDPGINSQTKEPIFILNLVARGLLSEKQGGVLGFFDLGRRLIVTSFKELTTPDMHRAWKLKGLT
jgi:uncharacterized protein (TIGR04255 family)